MNLLVELPLLGLPRLQLILTPSHRLRTCCWGGDPVTWREREWSSRVTTPCPLRLMGPVWGGAGVTCQGWWSSTCTTSCSCLRAFPLATLGLSLPGHSPAPGMLVGGGGCSTLSHGPATPFHDVLIQTGSEWKTTVLAASFAHSFLLPLEQKKLSHLPRFRALGGYHLLLSSRGLRGAHHSLPCLDLAREQVLLSLPCLLLEGPQPLLLACQPHVPARAQLLSAKSTVVQVLSPAPQPHPFLLALHPQPG